MQPFFRNIDKIPFKGPDADTPLAYRHYDKDQMVMGKSMEDHLRVAVCYWHTFVWQGNDPFGGPTLMRPWMGGGDAMTRAQLKLDVAFEFFEKLGLPFFCFHDRDVAPEGVDLAESNANLDVIVESMQGHMERTGVRLLWGTANLFSHHRYQAGAATNPDPDVFAYAAAQVKNCMDVTKRLDGANYVLWGGREGYETLLNTDMGRETDQLGRFMNMVVEYKHKIGFDGLILIEPKPQEPTKHQYDHDSATVHAFLQRHGLEHEIKVNIEANHATLAGHSFEHEIAYAIANGIFGSVDLNRGDPQLGWDTDQFPNNVPELTLAMYRILQAGGFTTGGFNFDAKLRRPSIDGEDLFHAHIGGMDTAARALRAAAAMIEDGALPSFVKDRYSGWRNGLGKAVLDGEHSLESLAATVADQAIDPQPISGRQEYLENLVNRFT